MPIMARPSAREMSQSDSRLICDYLLRMVAGKPHDQGHQVSLMSRIYETTQGAVDPADAFHNERYAMYAGALGDDTAEFLKAFNDVCEKFRTESKANKQARFTYSEAEQKILVAGLTKLKEATAGYGGFYFPTIGALHPRVNTHLCTGR